VISRRGAGRGTGEILSRIEEQVLNKGRYRINLSFRPLFSRRKKKPQPNPKCSLVAGFGRKPSKARKFKVAAATCPSALSRPEYYKNQWDAVQGPAQG